MNMSADPSSNRYVGISILLFSDQLIVAATNWIYWIIISKFASVAQIGSSTSIYSLILVITTFSQLGLEYPILKRSIVDKDKIFLSSLVLELAITSSFVPVLFLIMQNLYAGELIKYIDLAVAILFLSTVSFVAKFSLLGIYEAKYVLMIDISASICRLVLGIFLVGTGFGIFGILLSFLLQFLVIASFSLKRVRSKLGFGIGNLRYLKDMIREAIANTPPKFSRNIIANLIVIMLAYYGISQSEVGVFYVSLMISLVAGSLASSMAFMIIPLSTFSREDLSKEALRLALAITIPFVAAIISSPGYILSLIGPDYVSGELFLVILGMTILPSAIVVINISKLNNQGKSKQLVYLGLLQLAVFFISFIFLVPMYGTVGGALCILIAFTVSSVQVLISSEQVERNYVAKSTLSATIAVLMGYFLGFAGIHPIIVIICTIIISLVLLLALRLTSIREVRTLLLARGKF